MLINQYIEVRERTDALWHDIIQPEVPDEERGRLLLKLKTQAEDVLGVMDAAVDKVAEQVEGATVLHGKRAEGLGGIRREVGGLIADHVFDEFDVDTVLAPLISTGLLVYTAAEASKASDDRKRQLDEVKAFHTVAAQVQAELDRLRGGSRTPPIDAAQASTDSAVPRDDSAASRIDEGVNRSDNVAAADLISAARMQATLRDI